MRGLFTVVFFFIMLMNIVGFVIGAAHGSLNYKRDCSYKMKRFNLIIPGHKIGCNSSDYVVKAIDWLNEDI
jgi:hypothetical protein